MRDATDAAKPDDLIAANEGFHELIHKMSDCHYLKRLIERQRFYDGNTRRVIHEDAEERALALSGHTAIGAAICGRDEDAAEQSMRQHVIRSGDLYIQRTFGNRY